MPLEAKNRRRQKLVHIIPIGNTFYNKVWGRPTAFGAVARADRREGATRPNRYAVLIDSVGGLYFLLNEA